MPLELKVYITYPHQNKGTRIWDCRDSLVNTQRLQFIIHTNKRLAVWWMIKGIKKKCEDEDDDIIECWAFTKKIIKVFIYTSRDVLQKLKASVCHFLIFCEI